MAPNDKPTSESELQPAREERKYQRAAEYVGDAVWAIHPTALGTILQIIAERRDGHRPTVEEIRDRIGTSERPTISDEAPASPVAVIDIAGPIFPKANMMTEMSGATSLEMVQTAFREALASSDVRAIVLNIDSPGGSVDLVPEFAAEILKARGEKPIVAQASTWAASAAYWIASAADEIVVTPSGEVGSIGVYNAHEDISAMQEKLGVKTTLVSAGKYKVESNPFEPLSGEAAAEIQSKVDAYYDMFVSAVAKGRGTTKKTVLGDFGQGRMVMAEDAVSRGMADRVGTLDETLARLEKGSRQARAGTPEPQAERGGERRTVQLADVEWRDSSASGEPRLIMRGHAAVFDRLSLELGSGGINFRERILHGAFTDVLDGDPDVHLTWDHQTSLALARTRSAKYKLELREDPIGLHFYANVAPTSYAQDLRLLMESGVIDQASFVFNTPADGSGETWKLATDDAGNEYIERTISKVSELYDTTIAAQGAYPQTDTSVVARQLRNRVQSQIESGALPARAADLLPNVAPDSPAGRPASQTPRLGEGNERNAAPVGGEDDNSSHEEVGEEKRAEGLKQLKAHTRIQLELAKRRLLDAERERKRK